MQQRWHRFPGGETFSSFVKFCFVFSLTCVLSTVFQSVPQCHHSRVPYAIHWAPKCPAGVRGAVHPQFPVAQFAELHLYFAGADTASL